jgi:ATP adenylyltransferase/5',5'''-P-1,P-4-tetraphosphate phosphorylase II
METDTQLYFVSQTSKKKPETIRNKHNACPFCNVDELENIIAQEGSIILLENKYKTLKNTFQTVLIETADCKGELSIYNKDHLYRVIQFAIRNWLKFEKSGKFKSVLLFKNQGPLSGGSILHPHMQIVGLEKVDYQKNIHSTSFEGILIARNKSVEFNISTQPKIGFYEFNVVMQSIDDITIMADFIQIAAHFILNHFHFTCESYNLFFYHINQMIVCKIIPRFVTTPIYIGYSIPQVSDDISNVAEKVRKLYF